MRSAQAPFGTRAIMKKFVYVCNDFVILFSISVYSVYFSNVNKL